MSIEEFKKKVAAGDAVEFNDVISLIAENYRYIPQTFFNGIGNDRVTNAAGTNEGSCKIFAFAKLNGFTEEQTLSCFGTYYRDDVLKFPKGTDHENIRSFMKHGWSGIEFQGVALLPK